MSARARLTTQGKRPRKFNCLMLAITPCMNDRPYGAFGQLSCVVLKRMCEPHNAKLGNGRGHVGAPRLPKIPIQENARKPVVSLPSRLMNARSCCVRLDQAQTEHQSSATNSAGRFSPSGLPDRPFWKRLPAGWGTKARQPPLRLEPPSPQPTMPPAAGLARFRRPGFTDAPFPVWPRAARADGR